MELRKDIKFIADVNIEKPIIDFLSEKGYDVTWVADYNCTALDEDILMLANTQNRILLTNDKDFGELIFLQRKLSTGVILLRVKGQKTLDKITRVKKLLENYQDKIYNHFVVLTGDRIRFVSMEELK